jgi:hypothetical protein
MMVWQTEVLPDIRAEVISGKYIVQYLFAAGSSAAVLPVINAIGVGWAFTICKFYKCLVPSLVRVLTDNRYVLGLGWWSTRFGNC